MTLEHAASFKNKFHTYNAAKSGSLWRGHEVPTKSQHVHTEQTAPKAWPWDIYPFYSHTTGHFTCMCTGDLHAAGTKSQLTQTITHSSGNTSQGLVAAVNSYFVHMRRAVAGACIGGARQGKTSNCTHTFATITCPGNLKPQSNPVSYIRVEMKQALSYGAHSRLTQNVFTNTHSQLQLLRVPGTCTRNVTHSLSSSRHTISHPCFVTETCPAKVHLFELPAACWSNQCCKKDDFYPVNCSGARVCSFTTDLTNHRQQRNGNTILSCLRTCDKHTIG